jgi:uncharacterized protein YdcH (DUF465 family)
MESNIFVSGKVEKGFEISNSKVQCWRKCPFKWYLRYIEKIRPIVRKRSLTLGGWIHELLETHDKGGDIKAAFNKLKAKEWDNLFEEERAELGNLPSDVIKIINKYLITYKSDVQMYKPVLLEQEFKVALTQDEEPIVLTGKIDKVSQVLGDNPKYLLIEHKTAKRLEQIEDYKIMDTQGAAYLYTLSRMIQDGFISPLEVSGMMFDYIRSLPPEEPEVLKSGKLSMNKRTSADYIAYAKKVKELGLDMSEYKDFINQLKANDSKFLNRMYLNKSDTNIKNVMRDFIYSARQMKEMKNNPKAHYVKNLGWDCGKGAMKCEYLDACMLDLQGYDYRSLIGSLYEINQREEKEETKQDVEI